MKRKRLNNMQDGFDRCEVRMQLNKGLRNVFFLAGSNFRRVCLQMQITVLQLEGFNVVFILNSSLQSATVQCCSHNIKPCAFKKEVGRHLA